MILFLSIWKWPFDSLSSLNEKGMHCRRMTRSTGAMAVRVLFVPYVCTSLSTIIFCWIRVVWMACDGRHAMHSNVEWHERHEHWAQYRLCIAIDAQRCRLCQIPTQNWSSGSANAHTPDSDPVVHYCSHSGSDWLTLHINTCRLI